MRDAYIVTSVRTPGCKRSKGAFKDTRPEDLLSFILSAAVEKTENLEKKDVEDLMIGCSFPEAEQGLNIGRIAAQDRLPALHHVVTAVQGVPPRMNAGNRRIVGPHLVHRIQILVLERDVECVVCK